MTSENKEGAFLVVPDFSPGVSPFSSNKQRDQAVAADAGAAAELRSNSSTSRPPSPFSQPRDDQNQAPAPSGSNADPKSPGAPHNNNANHQAEKTTTQESNSTDATNTTSSSSIPQVKFRRSFSVSLRRAKLELEAMQDAPPQGGNGGDDDDEDEDVRNRLTRFSRRVTTLSSYFNMRGYDDDDDVDWWFASTACPLLAATIAPLANVLSIAALVTYWRMDINDGSGGLLPDFEGTPFRDPRWCYWINVCSLICGFSGNIFLLFNFTGRIRYIVALPVTIFFFYVATFALVGITVGMHLHAPPIAPYQIYSQGFWYAVMCIILYFIASSVLMVNMLGYLLGHYPQRFELNDDQRTLILQTMLFFAWLAGGAAIFSHTQSSDENWAYVDSLYFCDVTILTVGFGDLTPSNSLGRGLVFPFSVGGIIMLGLMISSIAKFAADMSEENVVHKHANHVRLRTLERTTTDPAEMERHEILKHFHQRVQHLMHNERHGSHRMHISSPFHARRNSPTVSSFPQRPRLSSVASSGRRKSVIPAVRKRTSLREAVQMKQSKLSLLQDERERFYEMRKIQAQTRRFKQWWALSLSVTSFAILWCVGAIVFWKAEEPGQDWTYFEALYFCYISLLTIGYGDFSPKSNVGRSFFVVWSLIAIPTMTLLISDMSKTIIAAFKHIVFVIADFTVLLRKNVWDDFLQGHPSIKRWIDERKRKSAQKKRLKEGMPVGDNGDDDEKAGDTNADVERQDSDLHPQRSSEIKVPPDKPPPFSPTSLQTSINSVPTAPSVPPISPTREKGNPFSPTTSGPTHPVSTGTPSVPAISPTREKSNPFSPTASTAFSPTSATPFSPTLANPFSPTMPAPAHHHASTSTAGGSTKPILKPTKSTSSALVLHKTSSRTRQHNTHKNTQHNSLSHKHSHHAARTGAPLTLHSTNLSNLAREITHDLIHPPPLPKLLRALSFAIRAVASDVKHTGNDREYSFEEWGELTRLMRFASDMPGRAAREEQPRGYGSDSDDSRDGDEGAVRWDWLGDDSPFMMMGVRECEFLLDRLCESLVRCASKIANRVEDAGLMGELERREAEAEMQKNRRQWEKWGMEEVQGDDDDGIAP